MVRSTGGVQRGTVHPLPPRARAASKTDDAAGQSSGRGDRLLRQLLHARRRQAELVGDRHVVEALLSQSEDLTASAQLSPLDSTPGPFSPGLDLTLPALPFTHSAS